MECSYAERLRNIALVAMSLELRLRSKGRVAAPRPGEKIAQDAQTLILLRRETDNHRKAVRDHIANCQRCQNTE
jgi:hypothetical protein